MTRPQPWGNVLQRNWSSSASVTLKRAGAFCCLRGLTVFDVAPRVLGRLSKEIRGAKVSVRAWPPFGPQLLLGGRISPRKSLDPPLLAPQLPVLQRKRFTARRDPTQGEIRQSLQAGLPYRRMPSEARLPRLPEGRGGARWSGAGEFLSTQVPRHVRHVVAVGWC